MKISAGICADLGQRCAGACDESPERARHWIIDRMKENLAKICRENVNEG